MTYNPLRHSLSRPAIAFLFLCSAAYNGFADAPVLTVGSPLQNGLTEDGKVQVFIKLFTWDSLEQNIKISHSLYDWNGNEIENFSGIPVKMSGEWRGKQDFSLPKYGTFRYKIELLDQDGKKIAGQDKSFTWMIPVKIYDAAKRFSSPIGVNTHAWANWKLLSRFGIHWARDYCWQWIGKGEKGHMVNGENFIDRVKSADEAGISTLPCLQKSFQTPDKRKWIEDAEQIRSSFKRVSEMFPSLPYFEIGNEEESAFPDHCHEAKNYANFVKNAAKGLDEAGKGAKIVLSGDCAPYYELIKEMLDTSANSFSAINYHCYTGTIPPEISMGDVNVGSEFRNEFMFELDKFRRINELAAKYGKEAWLTETGWDVTYGPAVGEKLQTVYLPRMYLLSRASGMHKIFWYFDTDQKGTIKFSSCGLIDVNGNVRPSAAALAALSNFTAFAKFAGSIYLGDDIVCQLWECEDGKFIAAVWTVSETHQVSKELLKASKVCDIFGNEAKADSIGPEIGYFFFDAIPDAWNQQRNLSLSSFSAFTAFPGTSVELVLNVGDMKPELGIENCPKSLSCAPWIFENGHAKARISFSKDAEAGIYKCKVFAKGDGWIKKWPIEIKLSPLLTIDSEPYSADSLSKMKMRLNAKEPMTAEFLAPSGSGDVFPKSLELKPETETELEFKGSEKADGILEIGVKLSNGASQKFLLRPNKISVKKDEGFAELKAEDVKKGVGEDYFVVNGLGEKPSAGLSWSEKGLEIAIRLPVKGLISGDPAWFWDHSNFEIFLADQDGKNGRQFFFVPVLSDGAWTLKAGEWKKRFEPGAENILDDKRCSCSMSYEKDTVNAKILIPMEALPEKIEAGRKWRAALAFQAGKPMAIERRACWPRRKHDGILDGTGKWGMIEFQD